MAEAAAGDEDLEENAAIAGVFKHLNYVVAWFKYYIKQKKTESSCPGFNVQGESCSGNLSYQDICQLIPLTDQQREYLEEKLAFLISGKLFDIKTCPGCQSSVERRDRGNLCVRCTICTDNLGRKYNFCWTCRREWKGLINNAERCGNNGCGGIERTLDPLIPCKPEFKEKMLQEKRNNIYPVIDTSTDRKRLALLINNVEFKNLNHRTGADKDEQSVEVLLKGLGYTVITLRDLSAQGMFGALRDFAQREEHDKSDSCFVVLMSHGDARRISGDFDSFENKDEEDVFRADEIFICLNTLNSQEFMSGQQFIYIEINLHVHIILD